MYLFYTIILTINFRAQQKLPNKKFKDVNEILKKQ